MTAATWSSGRRLALRHDFEVLVERGGPVEKVQAMVEAFPRVDGRALSTYSIRGVGRAAFSLTYDGRPVIEDVNAWRAVSLLSWHLNQSVIERSTTAFTILHAGAVARDGVAVLLPAPMEHGKTTTVAGLVRAGYDYLTDEAAALDPDTLRIHAYPKPLTLDRGSWPLFPELADGPTDSTAASWWVPASRIRADALVAEGSPALVVMPQYVAGGDTRLTPLPPAAALMEIAQTTFDFVGHPRRNLSVLARLVRTCPAFRLRIGDLTEAVTLVDSLVEEARCAA